MLPAREIEVNKTITHIYTYISCPFGILFTLCRVTLVSTFTVFLGIFVALYFFFPCWYGRAVPAAAWPPYMPWGLYPWSLWS
jgi:hypothetical protein